MQINRRSVALQVRDDLREKIQTGILGPGDQLPTEMDCSTDYGVSRNSVREAFKLLEQEGLIVARSGLGRYVAASAGLEISRPITLFKTVTELLADRGHSASSRVLSVGVRVAWDEESESLRLPRKAEVVSLKRFRLRDDDVVVYSECAFSTKLLPTPVEETDWSGSVISLLESGGRRVVSAVADLRAVSLPEAVAREHGLSTTTPWFLFIETTFDEKGQPILFAHDYVRGDIFSYHVIRRRET